MMDTDIKQRWVAALRSGKYPQTTGHLRDKDGYCCLGVLCDLKDSEKWLWDDDSAVYLYHQTGVILPNDVYEWAGLDGFCQDVFILSEDRTLTTLNDSGWTFEQIADVIEVQL
jgi:hypothetical protein